MTRHFHDHPAEHRNRSRFSNALYAAALGVPLACVTGTVEGDGVPVRVEIRWLDFGPMGKVWYPVLVPVEDDGE